MNHHIRRLAALLLLLTLCLTGCSIFSKKDDSDSTQITISAARKAQLTENYRAILSSSAPFYSVDAAADVTVEQLSQTLGDDGSSDVKLSAFSITDLNGDGEEEVLLWLIVNTNHSYGFTILHHIGDTVYGYTVPYTSLVDLKRDGTFSFYRSTINRGFASMSFTETAYSLEKITYRNGVSTFVVDGADASAEEFSAALSEQSDKSRAVWYHFTDANIQVQFPT